MNKFKIDFYNEILFFVKYKNLKINICILKDL